MSEQLPYIEVERRERLRGLRELVSEYFGTDDAELLDGMDDEEEQISYVYDKLLELGEDVDEVLREFGVIEREGSDEV